MNPVFPWFLEAHTPESLPTAATSQVVPRNTPPAACKPAAEQGTRSGTLRSRRCPAMCERPMPVAYAPAAVGDLQLEPLEIACGCCRSREPPGHTPPSRDPQLLIDQVDRESWGRAQRSPAALALLAGWRLVFPVPVVRVTRGILSIRQDLVQSWPSFAVCCWSCLCSPVRLIPRPGTQRAGIVRLMLPLMLVVYGVSSVMPELD